MQTVTVDEQGTVLINAASGGAQQFQHLQLPNGQILTPSMLRGQNVLPNGNLPAGLQAGILQNIAGQTVQFPGGMSLDFISLVVFPCFKYYQT